MLLYMNDESEEEAEAKYLRLAKSSQHSGNLEPIGTKTGTDNPCSTLTPLNFHVKNHP